MIILEIVGWFIASCVLMSFIEHQIHSRLMHKRSVERFKKTFVAHAITHHTDHYGKVFVDQPVPPGEDTEIRLRVHKAAIKGLPVILLIAPFSLVGAAVFAFTITLHHWIWNQIHLEMHKPERRIFSQWPVYKFLARYHFLHHRYPNKNFNVVFPLFDYVLGTTAHATAADKEQMALLGFLPMSQAPLTTASVREPELVGAGAKDQGAQTGSKSSN